MLISGQHIVLEDQLLGKLSGIELEFMECETEFFFQKFVDFCPDYT